MANSANSFQLERGVTARTKNGWWHMRFYDASRIPQRKEVALDTTEMQVAVQRANNKLERYRRGEYDPWQHVDRDVTIDEFMQIYKRERKGEVSKHTIATNLSPVRLLKEERHHEASIRSITARDVRDLVYRSDLSQGAKLSYWRKLNSVFNWAYGYRYVLENPVQEVDKPKEPESIPKYFTESELDQLLEAVESLHEANQKYIHVEYAYPLWPRDTYELAALTGLRRAELRRLNWGDIQWPERDEEGQVVRPGGVVVRSAKGAETKNFAERVVTMIPRAEKLLRRLHDQWRVSDNPSEPVLKNCTGEERVSTEYASRKFPDYCEHAGLVNISFHGLRHTFAAICRMRGMQIHTLKDEMGHSDIDQTLKYGAIGRSHRAKITYELFQDA